MRKERRKKRIMKTNIERTVETKGDRKKEEMRKIKKQRKQKKWKKRK